jgi:YhcH/YjgK/YiaL family protein
MITDRLENLERYRFEDPNMEEARKFLLTFDVMSLERRRHDIKGDEIFMNHRDAMQIPLTEARYEAHERYVDIHITLKGTDFIRTTEKRNLVRTTEYDRENDFILGDYDGAHYTDSYIGEGSFGIYFPEDTHLVNASPDELQQVEKFIVKVKIR